jgi:hypothetical protein
MQVSDSTTAFIPGWGIADAIWRNQLRAYQQGLNHTLLNKETPCHPALKGKERPWIQEFVPRWEKAKKLALITEMERIEKMILERDIREMTQGAGYPEVTDADLEAMFDFPRLRKKVRWHNFKARLPFTKEQESVVLRLKKDAIERAGVSIPYGAMLRYEEAKEMGFFTRFEVVYPNVITETELAAERRAKDPAIVGYFNGSMFLICSWDLPKDIAKAEAKMDELMALKLKD